jgi:hypothetical protein
LARCWCWWRRTLIVNRAVAARVHRGRATPYLRNLLAELNAAPSQCEAAVAAKEPLEVAAILFGKLAEMWRRDVVERRDTRCQGACPSAPRSLRGPAFVLPLVSR